MPQNYAPDFFDRILDGEQGHRFSPRGTTFINNFNTIVSSLKMGDEVDFIPEPNNKYDANAVKIVTTGSKQFIGYIPGEINKNFLDTVKDGYGWYGTIYAVNPHQNKDFTTQVIITPVRDEADEPTSKNHTVISTQLTKPDPLNDGMVKTELVDSGFFVEEQSAIDFVDGIRSSFGHPDTGDITDPVSSTRVLNSAKLLHNNDVIMDDVAFLLNTDAEAFPYDKNSFTDMQITLGDKFNLMKDGSTVTVMNLSTEKPLPWSTKNHDTLVARIVMTIVIKGLVKEDSGITFVELA